MLKSMKPLSLIVALILSVSAQAATIPNDPSTDARFLALETATQTGNSAVKLARIQYDVALQGGSTGTYDMGAYLPANAIIIYSLLYFNTQFVAVSGTPTLAIHCEDANNIFTATAVTNSLYPAGEKRIAAANTSSTFIGSIAADCRVTATIASAAVSAGKITGWIHYIVP